jgi:hypothetical protein
MGRKLWMCVAGVGALLATVIGANAAPAGAGSVPGTPMCRATALRVGASSTVVANPAGAPCSSDVVTGAAYGTPPPLRPVDLGYAVDAAALFAETVMPIGEPHSDISAEVGYLRLYGLVFYSIDLSGARAEIDDPRSFDPAGRCTTDDLHPRSSITFAATRNITFIQPPPLVEISTPLTIPLVVGTLHLNQTVVSGGLVTQRAAFLDLPGTANDVAVAEVTAGCLP